VPPKNTLVFVSCSVTWKHDVIHKNRKYVNTLHCRHKSTKPRPHVTCTENLVKHGCEICERTDRQTDRHAGRNTSTSTCFTSHSMSGVMSAVHYDTCCPSDQTTHLSVDTWWMNDRITSPPWLADMIHSAVCVCLCVRCFNADEFSELSTDCFDYFEHDTPSLAGLYRSTYYWPA